MLAAIDLSAQEPQGINYQGAVADADGTALANATIQLRLTVYALGTFTDLYVEDQTVQTDNYGTFDIVIGQGAAQGATYKMRNYLVYHLRCTRQLL